ncbi:DeoR/GlpR family DNA-binding transcription regulator [Rouxiella sp. Mn2063]|uniref:DeoR/GlpR family DNA-binding transcription regulator n=1 Tax=Rouxiella sp. Mn2063 TaxID=3395262 RepID=UPI003BE404FC
MLEYASFPEQRHTFIRKILQDEGRVVCTELSSRLNVSEHTVRRDLKELASEGVCKRVHGGAVAILPRTDNLQARAADSSSEKRLLALGAVKLIKQGSCIFVDAGSTNLQLAKALPDDLALTVVTNSPLIAVEAMKHPLCETIILGGRLDKQTGGSLGITAQLQLNAIHFDQTFLGACAMDPEQGVSAFNYEDAEFKKVLIARSNEIIVALTAEKFPAITRYCVASCDEISVLLVEESRSKDKIAAFADKDLTITLV